MDSWSWLYVGVGGFLGANARYLVSLWFSERFSRVASLSLPAGTLFVNVTGSLVLGVFLSWTVDRFDLSGNVRLMIATGFFGAYTTFSTFANESVLLLQEGDWISGAVNIIATNALCIMAAVIGLMLGSRL